MSSKKENNRRRSILLIVGGSVILLLFLAVVGWYLFNSGRLSAFLINLVATTEVPTISNDATSDAPVGIPEPEAPTTPTPGFVDNFDNGLDAVWTVIYGDPLIANGQLTSNGGAGITAGDPSWENYQIDFDVDATQVDCTFLDSSNSVGIRVTDFDHAYWFVFTSCTAAWSLLAGGENLGVLSLIPDTKVDALNKAKHITIQVDETKMSAFENGLLLTSIIDSRFHAGGIFLQIEAQTFYDNFKVTLLP